MRLDAIAFYSLAAALLLSAVAGFGGFDPSVNGLRFALDGPAYNYAIETRPHWGSSSQVDVWVKGAWSHYFLGLGRPLLLIPVLFFLLTLLLRRPAHG